MTDGKIGVAIDHLAKVKAPRTDVLSRDYCVSYKSKLIPSLIMLYLDGLEQGVLPESTRMATV